MKVVKIKNKTRQMKDPIKKWKKKNKTIETPMWKKFILWSYLHVNIKHCMK